MSGLTPEVWHVGGEPPGEAVLPSTPIVRVVVDTSLVRGIDAAVSLAVASRRRRALYRVPLFDLVRDGSGVVLTPNAEALEWANAQGWGDGIAAALERWDTLAESGDLEARAASVAAAMAEAEALDLVSPRNSLLDAFGEAVAESPEVASEWWSKLKASAAEVADRASGIGSTVALGVGAVALVVLLARGRK